MSRNPGDQLKSRQEQADFFKKNLVEMSAANRAYPENAG